MGDRWPLPEATDVSRARLLASYLASLDLQRRALETQLHLGTSELRILWLFSDGTARTLREIAESLRLEQSTVNRQVNAAHAAGLLGRSRPEAGNAYVFFSTESGVAAFEQDLLTSLGAYETALQKLGPEDAAVFLRTMRRFLDVYPETLRTPNEPGQGAAE
ncbi:MarR family winged helix-turn-helix transcriptional regulator [Arthrobacter rhombi]|uniref:Transcriptional regulator, MarR family n=1 Tax=Arthrobacter rhombi TaxID=71253 RepID=A0A1R4FSZ1_9MICC|nr:MarR family winged helix-turn-helix transcriptional regulator [Arthrobacter rhombi]SJM59110.1 Transcriptional regulator, MarR family [Arthrobacter rhombi]